MPAIHVPIFWLNWLNDLLKLNSFLVLEHKVRHELGPLAPPEAMQPVLAELRRALDTNKLDAVRIVLLKALGREDEAQQINDFMARRTSANNSHLQRNPLLRGDLS